MITRRESFFSGLCLEGFFFGIYSGIFALYLRCLSDKSRTTTILSYALITLYVLSAATIISDLVSLIIEARIRSLPLQDQIDARFKVVRLLIIQSIASGCCDFLAQGILIYRCWIVWRQNIYVMIVPSFLAVVCLATWIVSVAVNAAQGRFYNPPWALPMILTSLAASMAVNTLVTGFIVFRIQKVYFNFKANLDKRTSVSSSSSHGGTSLRHVIFVIIESGMTLFVVQLIRIVLANVGPFEQKQTVVNFVSPVIQMFYGITPTIILVRVSMTFNDEESFQKSVESLIDCAPRSDSTLNSSGIIFAQESNENID